MPHEAPWNRLTSPTLVGFTAMILVFSALTFVGVAIFSVAAAQFTIKPIWGVVLAILILAGPRNHVQIYLATCVASLAVRLAVGSPLVDSVIATAGGVGSVWAIHSLQPRIMGRKINFRDWLQLIEFFAITLYGTLAIGSAYAGALSHIYHRDFLQVLQVSALPTLLSFVIFTPLLVLITTIQLETVRRMKYRLVVSAVALLAVMAFICSGSFPYYYPVPLVLLVITLACDIEGTLVGLVIVVLALTLATLSGYGPTRNILPFSKQLLFDQIFLLALIFTLLPVAVALSERRKLHRDLLAALRHKDTLVAEQRLLYSASVLLRDGSYSESALNELVALLPQGWLFKECCQARISYRDFEVTTPDWRETPWRQSAVFTTRRGKGVIEVAYLEERPAAIEGPFLAEERAMLNALSELLVSYLEHEELVLERRALEEQLRQAQRKEAMGALAGGIAHDFNNLLGAIQGFSSLIHDELEQGSQAQRFAERISAACDRGKEIVMQILTFAREGVQQQRPVELCAFVRECEPLLSRAIAQGPALTFSYPTRDILIRGNSGQLIQLLTNLCVNASAACNQKQGNIHVQIDLPASSEILRIADLPHDLGRHRIGFLDKAASYVRFRVTDNGAGIAPDVLQRIFDPFFTTKGRQQGSGLGLSVCHGIVESHNSFCLVETELGKGTCFSVFLPIIGEAQAATPPAPSASPSVRGSEHVMLVEDEVDVRDVMTIGLQRLGYKVSAFNDPADALAAFQEEPAAWDIVIADHIMPKMYGLELLERLKAINPDIPTILCSGHTERDVAPVSKAVGFCLSKPVSFPELNQCMRALLATHAANSPPFEVA
jgi:signal transduction histidine kinase/ActR/RegA family two-component response regulator